MPKEKPTHEPSLESLVDLAKEGQKNALEELRDNNQKFKAFQGSQSLSPLWRDGEFGLGVMGNWLMRLSPFMLIGLRKFGLEIIK